MIAQRPEARSSSADGRKGIQQVPVDRGKPIELDKDRIPRLYAACRASSVWPVASLIASSASLYVSLHIVESGVIVTLLRPSAWPGFLRVALSSGRDRIG
jgi:hypothetical protein